MARPLRIEYEGAFYHVIQRGIERKNIFLSDKDKERFFAYLNSAHQAYSAIIHAYILMNNHYHIILETPRANLSKIMHYLNTAYAAYFNSKHKRVGPLYQGRFKAILVQEDEYLHHLSRYIHLNPVRVGISKLPEEYPWSSYSYFISNQKTPRWLNVNFILSIFDESTSKAKRSYKQFVLDGIGSEKDIIRQNTLKGLILGSHDFFASIKAKFINAKDDYEIPILKEIKSSNEPTMEYIKHLVEENVKNDKRLQRKVSIYLSRKYTQKTLNQIAEFYGKITYTGISQVFRRAEKARRANKKLDTVLLKIEEKLSKVKTWPLLLHAPSKIEKDRYSVEYFLDEQLIYQTSGFDEKNSTQDSFGFIFDTTRYENGLHKLIVNFWDKSGPSAIGIREIIINNHTESADE